MKNLTYLLCRNTSVFLLFMFVNVFSLDSLSNDWWPLSAKTHKYEWKRLQDGAWVKYLVEINKSSGTFESLTKRWEDKSSGGEWNIEFFGFWPVDAKRMFSSNYIFSQKKKHFLQYQNQKYLRSSWLSERLENPEAPLFYWQSIKEGRQEMNLPYENLYPEEALLYLSRAIVSSDDDSWSVHVLPTLSHPGGVVPKPVYTEIVKKEAYFKVNGVDVQLVEVTSLHWKASFYVAVNGTHLLIKAILWDHSELELYSFDSSTVN